MDIVFPLFDGRAKNLPDYSAGAGYDASWGDKLARAIQRNTSKPHRFVAVVDRGYAFEEDISTIHMNCEMDGWGCIMECFRPDIGRSRRMVLGLDTIVAGNIDHILAWRGECGLLTDPYETHTVCNGVGIFSAKECNRIWALWQKREEYDHTYKSLPSEMAFLRTVCAGAVRLDSVFPDEIQSYKANWRKYPETQAKARIVYFHGTPKPPQVEPQLLEHWQ